MPVVLGEFQLQRLTLEICLFLGLTLLPGDPLMGHRRRPVLWISWNPFPIAVGEGFRLLGDWS